MNADDLETATLVLGKCASKDPWFPVGGDALIQGWAEVFAACGLSREDLLAGVELAYLKSEDGFKPLPASIVRFARDAYFESLKALPEDRRQLMEEANHILQGMGIAPPDAHRYARRVALGREPQFRLTDTQHTEFRRRLAERQALQAQPRKPIIGSSWFKGPKTPQPSTDPAPDPNGGQEATEPRESTPASERGNR
ncbi:hypothetical protein [Rhodococcus jostii]|uniref:hypothetical protein n=1 Tax=Rhodococcus jostii TaxID=132919 RepID=UPI0036338B42